MIASYLNTICDWHAIDCCVVVIYTYICYILLDTFCWNRLYCSIHINNMEFNNKRKHTCSKNILYDDIHIYIGDTHVKKGSKNVICIYTDIICLYIFMALIIYKLIRDRKKMHEDEYI